MLNGDRVSKFPVVSAFSYEDDRLELSRDPKEGVFYVTQYYGKKGSFVHGCAADRKFATILFDVLAEDIKRKHEKETE